MVRFVALILLGAAPLAAQTPALRTVHGQVRDTAGQPLDQVQVIALGTGRSVRTGPDGVFRLDSIESGEERFLFRRVGYHPVEATFLINDDDTDVMVHLTPAPQILDPVVVRARRSGVFGTIGDVQYQPIGDAEVRVLGGGAAVQTDSLGRFNLPSVPAGTFMLTVRKKGYYVLRRSITLAVAEPLEISLLLVPLPPGLSDRRLARLAGFGGLMDFAWDAHMSRRVRCAGGDAAFVPREELAEQGALALDAALLRAASASTRGFARWELRDYALFVDGQNAQGWPLSGIRAEDVEAVEIYRGVRRQPRLTILSFGFGGAPDWPAVPGACPRGTVWVWLR